MRLNKTIGAVCGATILSLSLISCNSKEAGSAKKPTEAVWGLPEPMIISSNGEVKYSEANTKGDFTYRPDDRLEIEGVRANNAIHLRFRTICMRGQFRFNLESSHTLRSSYSLYEFLPAEVLYSTDGAPLKNVNCTLDIMAENGKSRHAFPALNLQMADGGPNDLELFLNSRKIANDKVETLTFKEFQNLQLPRVTGDNVLTMHCASFALRSGDQFVRQVSDLRIARGQVTDKEERPQFCRAIVTRDNIVQSVSPFLKVQFFNIENLVTTVDNGPATETGTHDKFLFHTLLLTQKIKNNGETDVILKFPERFKIELNAQTLQGIVKKDGYAAIEIVQGIVLDHKDGYFFVKIPSRSDVIFNVKTKSQLVCRKLFNLMRVESKAISLSVQALNPELNEVLAEWPLITDTLKIYTYPQATNSSPPTKDVSAYCNLYSF